MPAQEVRALLTTRKLVLSKRIDMEMGLRGILRGFGLKIGPTTPRTLDARVRELVDSHPTLLVVAEALLTARSALIVQLKAIERRLVGLARDDTRTRRLMSTPGRRRSSFIMPTIRWVRRLSVTHSIPAAVRAFSLWGETDMATMLP